jgi:hypothetical protein
VGNTETTERPPMADAKPTEPNWGDLVFRPGPPAVPDHAHPIFDNGFTLVGTNTRKPHKLVDHGFGPGILAHVLTSDQFVDAAKNVISRLDKTGTTGVTKEQLARALQDRSFIGADAQALGTLYQNFDSLHNLSKRGDTSRITLGDIDAFQKSTDRQSTLAHEKDKLEENDWFSHILARFKLKTLTAKDIDTALDTYTCPN